MFGGAASDELNMLSFSAMAKSKSWKITPSLEDIQTVMETVGAEKTILSIDFRQPYVLDEDCGFLNAGAILATFGVSDAAIMDILTGKFNPTGKLPYALANSLEAVMNQAPDCPGLSGRRHAVSIWFWTDLLTLFECRTLAWSKFRKRGLQQIYILILPNFCTNFSI